VCARARKVIKFSCLVFIEKSRQTDTCVTFSIFLPFNVLGFTLRVSPGPPPGPVHLPVQKKKNFSPLRCTGRWKFATNGGSSQHFYKRLNASKSARIESREDSKTHSVAKIGKNGCFYVKRARRFRNGRVLNTPESSRAPKMGESHTTNAHKNAKNNHYISTCLDWLKIYL